MIFFGSILFEPFAMCLEEDRVESVSRWMVNPGFQRRRYTKQDSELQSRFRSIMTRFFLAGTTLFLCRER